MINYLTTLLISIGAIIVWVVYYIILKNRNYFNSQNVKYSRGWPIVGSLVDSFTGKLSFPDLILKLYWAYPKEKLIGIYECLTPTYFIRDPEIIRQVGIKDFDHFVNHNKNFGEKIDPIIGKGLIFIRDQRWRDMRTTLSPSFTGNKMKIMFSLINDCSNVFVDHIKLEDRKVYEMKDLSCRFANDIIATCVFGLNVNSLSEPENQFYKAGASFANTDGFKGLTYLLYAMFPKVMKFLKVKIVDDETASFFRNIINETIKHRQSNNIIRPDMIHLLMEARKDSKKIREWDDDDLVAQFMIFFFAGFETTSTLLSFMSYELVVNSDIQQRLYEEIVDTEQSLNGYPLTYDILNKLKYLDCVVSETLRRWPPAPITTRFVNKSYKIEYNGQTVQLNQGDSIWFPVFGLQMDEQYFSNPEKFDPERFNDENRDKIHSGTYLPFGIGPRSCIGSRFALMECKSLLYRLLLAFSFERCDRTQYPLKLKKNTFSVTCEKGLWIELRPRK